MTSRKRIAILGAGIMGASLALFLARRGFDVHVFDREARAVDRASRWNEGKIHLGYLYGADPTLETARRVIPGGLRFSPLMSELIATDLSAHVTTGDDYFLVHRNSVVDADTLGATLDGVSALLREHADAGRYFVDLTTARAERLSRTELDRIANTENITAGFSVPERSVNTNWIADRLIEAMASEPGITLRLQTEISFAKPQGPIDGTWRVGFASGGEEVFDMAVNALWDGRIAIDMTAGLQPEAEWSNRYRLALFAHSDVPLTTKCAIVAVGPFGDIKNYNGHDFYLSWYPAGLMQQDSEIAPTDPRPFSDRKKAQVIAEARANLATVLPEAEAIFENATDIRVEGGFVFAYGQGSIGDARSTLHRRDRFGTRRLGNYLSIDTGKYSAAPWIAAGLAREIAGD